MKRFFLSLSAMLSAQQWIDARTLTQGTLAGAFNTGGPTVGIGKL